MKKLIKVPVNYFPNGNERQTRPIVAILLFCIMVLVVCFYNSRKVILWEDLQEAGGGSVFKVAAVSYANAAEDVKVKFKLNDLFLKENMVWRSAKESPLVFGQPEASLSLYADTASMPTDTGVATSTLGETRPLLPEVEIPPINLAATTTAVTAATTTAAVPPVSDLLRREGEIKTPQVLNLLKKKAPFRMLIVGDSFVAAGGGLGDPLERVLLNYKDTVVTRQGKVSSGLSRQDYFNWPELTAKLIGQHNPNVAIMMFGANDNIPVIAADGTLLAGWGSAKWDDQYRKRIDQMLDIFTTAKTEIFVIGVPVMKNTKLAATMKHINSLYEEEVKKYPNAHYISTWDLLSDKNGNYTDSLLDKNGNKRLIRTSDGVHLQYFAGYYVADAVAAVMKNYLDLKNK